MANILTGFRIVCSVLLGFFPVFSVEFYVFYLLAGFSDMIDGTVARMTNQVSEFGAKFDTVADLVFVGVLMFRLLPVLSLPWWIWGWIVVIALIKVINIGLGFMMHGKFMVQHTLINKVTGLLLFGLPLSLSLIDISYSGFIVCCVALFAALQEGYYIIKQR